MSPRGARLGALAGAPTTPPILGWLVESRIEPAHPPPPAGGGPPPPAAGPPPPARARRARGASRGGSLMIRALRFAVTPFVLWSIFAAAPSLAGWNASGVTIRDTDHSIPRIKAC